MLTMLCCATPRSPSTNGLPPCPSCRRTAGWRPLAGACWCPLASSWPAGEKRAGWPLQQLLLLRLTRATSYTRLLAGNDMACCPCPLSRCTRSSFSSPSPQQRCSLPPSSFPLQLQGAGQDLVPPAPHPAGVLLCCASSCTTRPAPGLGQRVCWGTHCLRWGCMHRPSTASLHSSPRPLCLHLIADPGLCDGHSGPGPGLCTGGRLGGRGLE